MPADEESAESPASNPKAELAAMQAVLTAVEGLSPDSTKRVLEWVGDSLGLLPAGRGRSLERATQDGAPGRGASRSIDADPALGCTDAASFVDATGATNGLERALAVAYWIQIVGGKDSWASAEVNQELKHQGHADSNITRTLDAAMAKKPALVVQLQKSGSAKQARKLYKITTAGQKLVAAGFAGPEQGQTS